MSNDRLLGSGIQASGQRRWGHKENGDQLKRDTVKTRERVLRKAELSE